MHSTTETTEPLNCCFCLKTCVNIEDLQAHIGSEHFNYHPFTCAYCPEGDGRSKFSTKAAIKRHCASEHGMTRFHIRLWVSDQVENDEKEIEKCLQKCVNNSRRSQPLALALPSQPQRIENQMVEFPSPDDRYTQPVGVTPQPLDISFTTSSSGSNYSNGRLIRPNTTRTSNPRNSVVDRNVDQNVTGEHDDYTDSSGSTSRNRNESGAEVRSVPAVSATAHIIVDERSLNPFRKSLTNPSPPRKRRHDMATPSPINNNNNNNHNNRIKQIAKKSCIQEVDEKDVFNIRRQAFVNSSYNSQLQLTSEQRYEDTDQNRSLTRSQRSLNSSAHFNSSGLSYSGGGGSSSSKLKKQLKCTSCKKLYRNNNYDMRSHINNTHLRLPLYSCAECNKHFFNRRHKAVEHIHEFHRGKQNLLIDNTAIYEPIVAARLLEFFPDATIFPNRTPTPAYSSKRIVSRGHSIQSISQRQAPVRRQNSCSTPSLVRTRSVGPETRSQNTGNAGSNQKRPTCSQPASSGGIKRFLRSGANTSLPILQRAKSTGRLEIAAARPVLTRGRSMPPREPSPLTTFAYDSGSDLNETEQPSFSREKTQLPSCFSPEYAANIYKGDRIKKLECGKCKTKVVAKLDWILFNHVNINHLKVPAFDCLICGESFCEYSGTSIKRHMKGYHSDRLDSYQDNRPFYRSQLQEMCLKYFERK